MGRVDRGRVIKFPVGTRRTRHHLRGADGGDGDRGSHEPVIIEVASQKDEADCGIAALAMLTGKGYAGVAAVIPKRWKVGSEGMSRRQLTMTAARLGCPIRFIKDGDLSNMVGILDLQRFANPDKPGEGYEGHWAIVAKGVVINPADGMVWTDVDAFFKARGWVPLGVYVRKGDE